MQKLCRVRTRQQFSASLDYFVTSLPPYHHQFSTISGGNCIKIVTKHQVDMDKIHQCHHKEQEEVDQIPQERKET